MELLVIRVYWLGELVDLKIDVEGERVRFELLEVEGC